MREIILMFYHRNRSKCLVNTFRLTMIIYCNVIPILIIPINCGDRLRQAICEKGRLIVKGAIMRSRKMTA